MIYIATWGDPSGWATDAKYVCEDSRETRGFSGIFCYDRGKFDKVIIVTLDSILTPTRRDNPNNKRAGECIKGLDVTQIKDYDTWKAKTQEYIRCIIPDYNPEVIVLPAIGKYGDFTYGKYKNTWIRPEHLKVILAYELYEKLKDVKKDEEIVLDITHGVNYVGALILLTLQKLSSLLKFRLTVINFIPTVMLKEFSFTEVYRIRPGVFDYDSIDDSNVSGKVIKAIVQSLKRNSVLMLTYLCENSGDSLPSLGFKPEIAGNEIRLAGELSVKKEDQAWANIVTDYLCRKVRSAGGGRRYVSSLRGLAKEVYGNSAFAVITDKELNDLWLIASNNLGPHEERLYKDIRMKEQGKSTESERESENIDVIRRNFIAHAGLLKDMLRVKRVDDKEFELSYDLNRENVKMLGEILEAELNGLLGDNN